MLRPDAERKLPAFQRIKDHIVSKIRAGDWREGDTIPTEEALGNEFSVSRMTVNRALRELASEQILVRIQGSGTFVAQEKYQATLVEIKSIAEEIKARGHAHHAELQRLERVRASEAQAKQFGLKPSAELFHSLIIHSENGVPIQVEDRWVNKAIAPDYMTQNFRMTTPNEYLLKVAPLQGVQYWIEATLPPADIAEMLRTSVHKPALVLRRKTLSFDQVASIATMWHPGNKYQFSGGF